MSQALDHHYTNQHFPTPLLTFLLTVRPAYFVPLVFFVITTWYRSHREPRGRRCADLSLRAMALFRQGLTPSKTAAISWRPSMPAILIEREEHCRRYAS